MSGLRLGRGFTSRQFQPGASDHHGQEADQGCGHHIGTGHSVEYGHGLSPSARGARLVVRDLSEDRPGGPTGHVPIGKFSPALTAWLVHLPINQLIYMVFDFLRAMRGAGAATIPYP